MNWFVKKRNAIVGTSEDRCEHLQDGDHSHTATEERDSFGGDGYYHMCEACANKLQEEEDNRTVVCKDCKSVVLSKDTITWKWYDFYEAQGDIALVICKSCANGAKHQERVDRDRRDYQAEFGSDDVDDFDDEDEWIGSDADPTYPSSEPHPDDDEDDDQDVDLYGSDGHYID